MITNGQIGFGMDTCYLNSGCIGEMLRLHLIALTDESFRPVLYALMYSAIAGERRQNLSQ